MTPGQSYKVRKGDTLSGIAKAFGHRRWETIWTDAENRALVSKRKKPELIQPGDQLLIPPNEGEKAAGKAEREQFLSMLDGQATRLKQQVAMMDEIIADHAKASAKVVAEMEGNLRDLRSFAGKVDRIAGVSTALAGMHKDLARLSLLGRAALNPHGAKLKTIARHAEDVIKKIGKDHGKDKLKEEALAAVAEHKNSTNEIVALVGTGLDWWEKVEKPSFWASAYLNWKDGASPTAAMNKARLTEVGGEIEDRIASVLKQDAAFTAGLKKKRDILVGRLQETQVLARKAAAQP